MGQWPGRVEASPAAPIIAQPRAGASDVGLRGRRGWGARGAESPGGFAPLNGGAPAIPTPAAIFGANLTQWLDERGMAVSQWTDQSGNANHFVQADAGLQPSAGATINGYSTLLFDGVDNVMTSSDLDSITGRVGFAFFAVLRTKTVPAAGGAVYLQAHVVGDANGVVGVPCTTMPRLWDFDTGYKNGNVGTFASDTLYAFAAIKGATGLVIDISGQAATVAVASGDMANPAAMWLGQTFGSAYGNFEIAFLASVNVEPSAGQLAQMSAYLLAKYGIAPS